VSGKKRTGGLSFYAATTGWLAGLVALALLYQVIVGASLEGSGSIWTVVHLLAGWIGALLPFATFAGGLAACASLSPRSVAFRGFLLSIVAYGLLAYGSPIGDFQVRATVGADLTIEFPFGPETPGGLRALRSAVEADPPADYSFSVDRPLEQSPNWLTYLLHSFVVIAAFAVLGALLGQQAGFLTSGLSPPTRRNARWALGLLSAAAFFLAEGAGGEWVRLDPSNSGVLGAWMPLLVPLLALVLLTAVARRRRLRLDSPTSPSV